MRFKKASYTHIIINLLANDDCSFSIYTNGVI